MRQNVVLQSETKLFTSFLKYYKLWTVRHVSNFVPNSFITLKWRLCTIVSGISIVSNSCRELETTLTSDERKQTLNSYKLGTRLHYAYVDHMHKVQHFTRKRSCSKSSKTIQQRKFLFVRMLDVVICSWRKSTSETIYFCRCVYVLHIYKNMQIHMQSKSSMY